MELWELYNIIAAKYPPAVLVSTTTPTPEEQKKNKKLAVKRCYLLHKYCCNKNRHLKIERVHPEFFFNFIKEIKYIFCCILWS